MISRRATTTRSTFVVAACPLLGLALILYWSLHHVSVHREALSRTQVIERNLQALGEDLLDAETGQRGYILTLDDKYLEPYLAAKANVPKRLDVLARFMIGPAARSDLDRIRPLVSAKLAELATTVELAAAGQRDHALRVVAEGSGKRLMDDFRAVRQDTISSQRELLEQRYVHIEEGLSRVALILLLGAASESATLGAQASRLHKLQGGAGTLGAKAIQHLAADAEAACVAGDVSQAGARLIELRAHLEALRSSAARAFEAARTGPMGTPRDVRLESQAAAEERSGAPSRTPRRA